MTGWDTIVVGLGAVGSATLRRLAQRGQRVLGIDRWEPPHAYGSSHGESRITRCAVGEGFAYVPFVRRSHEIWRELEAETGESLLDTCGALMLSPARGLAQVHGKDGFVRSTIAAAEHFGIAHEVLEATEVERRFPQFRLRGDEIAYYEPGGGYVRPERCIAAQLASARRHGATMRLSTRVTEIGRDGSGVRVETEDGERFLASRAVLSAGAWSAGLIGGELGREMIVLRQALHWFAASNPADFVPGRFPVFIWCHGDGPSDNFYGFPILPGSSWVKVATEQFTQRTHNPDRLCRDVDEAEAATVMREHVAGRLPGLAPQPMRSVACAYTYVRDGDFLIERAPDNEHVLLVSACSGHGFKHSAGLGERVADILIGDGEPLATFGAARLAPEHLEPSSP